MDYITKGVRYVFRGNHSAGIVNTFSQDLEPESVTISNDDRFAFVSCQRNNAILKIDMFNQRIIELYSLGSKNWANLLLDASDLNGGNKRPSHSVCFLLAPFIRNNGANKNADVRYISLRAAGRRLEHYNVTGPNLRQYKVYSFYQPAQLAYSVIDGKGYVVSVDTGKMTTYTQAQHGVAFNDHVRARDAWSDNELDTTTMDPMLLAQIQDNHQLGRVYMSRVDGYNIYNKIGTVFLFGGRGISLWDSTTMAHVIDSGDELERRASQLYPNTFNGDCSNGNQSPTQQVEERSPYMVRPDCCTSYQCTLYQTSRF
nr:mesenchyme-specific cell surface glycoprotein-like [Crassostrea gigas]